MFGESEISLCLILCLYLIIVIAEVVIEVWLSFRCRGIVLCRNKKCKYRRLCGRYLRSCENKITEEEAKDLKKLLDSWN